MFIFGMYMENEMIFQPYNETFGIFGFVSYLLDAVGSYFVPFYFAYSLDISLIF